MKFERAETIVLASIRIRSSYLMREAIRESLRGHQGIHARLHLAQSEVIRETLRGHEATMGVVLGDSRFSKRSSGPPARSGMKKRCRESSSTAPLDACTTVEL